MPNIDRVIGWLLVALLIGAVSFAGTTTVLLIVTFVRQT